MTQVLTLDQCPASVQAHFLAMPGFQQAMRITKSTSVETGTPSQVVKTLKTGHREPARKAANLPGFAAILAGSVNRNVGDAPPAIPVAPAPTVKPFPAPRDTPAPSVGKPLPQAFNRPKEPLRAERGNAVEFKDLQAAIDAALSKQRDEAKAEAFNAGRSAFARLAPTKKSEVQGGGLGSAHALRNLGGRLAASVLNSTTRKDETRLPTNTGFRAVSGASLKA
ncbi:hypothetical protein [Ottowia sp.]|uniref:hypothetical protein n=1 Tax=Ottowia sp. TaxID=1898956 RepID=UPI003A896E32